MTVFLQRPFLFAVVGAVLVVLGSFAPAADIAIYGTVTYWEAAGPEAVVMIVAAVAVVVLLASGKVQRARLAAMVMWCALLWPYLEGCLEPDPDGFLAETFDAFTDTATDFTTDIALNFVDISWGTLVLSGGCLLLTLNCRKTR
jgi:hypothetical protein